MGITIVLLYPQEELIGHKVLMYWPFLPLPTRVPLVKLHAVDDMLFTIKVNGYQPPYSRITVWSIISRLKCVVRKH